MTNTHAHYLLDLGRFIRSEAVQLREEAQDGDDFKKGHLFGYYAVLSLMQQQAESFRLPLKDLSLEGLDPDDLLAPY